MSNQKYLSHYGILGMKWGIRRQPGPDGLVGKSRGQSIVKEGLRKFNEAGKLHDRQTMLRIEKTAPKTRENFKKITAPGRNALALVGGGIMRVQKTIAGKSHLLVANLYGKSAKSIAKEGNEIRDQKDELLSITTGKQKTPLFTASEVDSLVKQHQVMADKDFAKYTKHAAIAKKLLNEASNLTVKQLRTKVGKKSEPLQSERMQSTIESSKKYLEKRPDLMMVYDKKYDSISYASKNKANRKLDIDYSDSSRYTIYE